MTTAYDEAPGAADVPSDPGGGGGAGSRPGGGGGGTSQPGPGQSWWRAERLMPQVLRGTTFVPLLLLVGILAVLTWKAIPAIRYNGLGFFSRSVWNLGNLYAPLSDKGGVSHPPGALYGAWPLIVGTLATSAIAVIVGFPVAVGAAGVDGCGGPSIDRVSRC